jgi:hypothetical protein
MANFYNTIDTAGVSVQDGYYSWTVYGTWGGASAQLEWSPDNGTNWIALDGISATANGGFIEIPISEGKVRTTITGGSGVSLKANLQQFEAEKKVR